MPLSFDSPRFSLRSPNFDALDAALKSTGHVVLENVWDTDYLASLHEAAAARFERDDARFANGFDGYPDSLIECYLGSFIGLEGLFDDSPRRCLAEDRKFFSAVELSGLPALLRHLLNGDIFVAQSERCIRRADPKFAIRFIGLHPDGQLHLCSSKGINSKRELTIWTPLQPCVDEVTPRLLLMQKGESYTDLFDDDDEVPAIERRWKQIRNEAEVADVLRSRINEQFDLLFSKRRCYAPYVPFGGSIIFEAGVMHASYVRDGMTIPRFSLDFRSVGDFKRADKNRNYIGQTFRMVPVEARHRISEQVVQGMKLVSKGVLKTAFPWLRRTHA